MRCRSAGDLAQKGRVCSFQEFEVARFLFKPGGVRLIQRHRHIKCVTGLGNVMFGVDPTLTEVDLLLQAFLKTGYFESLEKTMVITSSIHT